MGIDLKNIPNEITAGDTLNFTLQTSLSNTAQIEIRIQNEISQIKQLHQAVDGLVVINIAAEETKKLASGGAVLTLRAIDGDIVKTLFCGPLSIIDIGKSIAMQELLTWKKNLEAIDAVLGKNAGSEFSFYMIAGRQVNKMAPTELIRLREYFLRQIKHSEAEFRKAKGLRRSNVIVTRFGRQY